MNQKTVLVTGGNGFIGSNLVNFLLRNNYSVHLLLRRTSKKLRLINLLDKVNIHESNLLNVGKLKTIVKKIKPAFIIHLSSYGNYPDQKQVRLMIKTNIIALSNLLEATKEINYRSFIIAGSSSEYGFRKTPMEETDLLNPESFYAASKGAATLIAQTFAKIYKKPIVILRLFSVYGPYEKKTRFIPVVINAGLGNSNVPLTPNTARRDFIFVEDVISVINLLMRDHSFYGEIFNIGTGKQYSNEEIVDTVSSLLQKSIKIERGKYENRAWDTDFWVANINKTSKMLGWKPKYTLEIGLKKTIDWFKSNNSYY